MKDHIAKRQLLISLPQALVGYHGYAADKLLAVILQVYGEVKLINTLAVSFCNRDDDLLLRFVDGEPILICQGVSEDIRNHQKPNPNPRGFELI